MMAYMDWDFEEVSHTDGQVQWRLENNPKESTRHDMADIFREAEEDMRVQKAHYSLM
jgi:hypothetical protein